MTFSTEIAYLELADGSSCVFLNGAPIYGQGSKLVSDVGPLEVFSTLAQTIPRPSLRKLNSHATAPEELQYANEQNPLWVTLYAKETSLLQAA